MNMTDHQGATIAEFCERASGHELLIGLCAVCDGMPAEDQKRFWNEYGADVKRIIFELEDAAGFLRGVVDRLEPAN